MLRLLFGSATYLFCIQMSFAQQNLTLKKELDSMYVLDQQYREYMSVMGQNARLTDSLASAFGVKPDQVSSSLWEKQSAIDSSNLVRAEALLKQYGYPGKTLVGTPTNEAVWYVIQHSDKIREYLPIMRRAGQAGELPFPLVAMMEDRQLMYDHKPQRYGTQGSCYPLRQNAKVQECFIWPIEQPAQVNKRRKEAGFEQTVEENAKRLAITYKTLTMTDVKTRYAID